MSGKTTAYSQAFLEALFQAVFTDANISAIFANAGAPITNLYISLHSADPGIAGNQTTNEADYTGYARVAVARSAAGFTVSGQEVYPAANITFAAPTAINTVTSCTYFGIGQAASGVGKLMYTGPISPTITLAVSTPPVLAGGTSSLTNVKET